MSDTETYLKDLAKYPSSWITTEGPYAHTGSVQPHSAGA